MEYKRPAESTIETTMMPSTKRKLDSTEEKGAKKHKVDDQILDDCVLLVNSLTTPLSPSYFDGKEYQEIIDYDMLEKLLKSDVLRKKDRKGHENGGWEFLTMMKLNEEAVQLYRSILLISNPAFAKIIRR